MSEKPNKEDRPLEESSSQSPQKKSSSSRNSPEKTTNKSPKKKGFSPIKAFKSLKKKVIRPKHKNDNSSEEQDESQLDQESSDNSQEKSDFEGEEKKKKKKGKKNSTPSLALVGSPRYSPSSGESDDLPTSSMRSQTKGSKQTADKDDSWDDVTGDYSSQDHSSSSDVVEEKQDGQKGKKKKAPRAGAKQEAAYIETPKRRTQKVKDRCLTIQEKCKEVMLIGGAKVHFRAEYTGSTGRIYPYSFGENFYFSSEKASPQKRDTLESIVKRAVASGMKAKAKAVPEVTPSTSYLSLTGSQDTPTTQRREKTKRPNACDACQQIGDQITLKDHFGGTTRVITTVTLLCAHVDEDGNLCKRVMHADCLGFVGVTDDQVQAMPDWYCRIHRADGRAFKNCVTTASGQVSPSQEKTKRDDSRKKAEAKVKTSGVKGKKKAATKSKSVVPKPKIQRKRKEGATKKAVADESSVDSSDAPPRDDRSRGSSKQKK